ncbi:MAG: phasin family protein [Pseudomonadota bacterium]|nr:phasin family protein [Pseudomonadota bacterium]
MSTSSSQSSCEAPASAPGAEHSHNIWLAGLGALARAQAEGSKAFDALVKQGLALQNQTQAMAQEQLAEAAQRMEAMAASPVGAGRWNALEGIFEQRVARAAERLGLPGADTVARLEARIAALEQALAAAQAAPASIPRKTQAAAKRAPAKRTA